MQKHFFVVICALLSIDCNNSSKEIILTNNWFNTIEREQVFRDSEYNLINAEPAIDTTYLNIMEDKIIINFKLKYLNDSINSYDTTVIVPYTKKGNKLLFKIRDKEYLAGYMIKEGYLYFQEIDKIPFFIKNTDFIFSRKIYQRQ